MDHAKNYGSSLYYRRYFINHLVGDAAMKILGDICLTIGWLVVNFIAPALDGIYWISDKACWILGLVGKGASNLYNAYPKITITAIPVLWAYG